MKSSPLQNKSNANEELYRELFTPLFRYVFFRTRDYELASDLTQSAFLKFLLQAEMPRTKEHSMKLLFTITRTLLIDHWRVSSKRMDQSIEESDIDPPSELPDPQKLAIMNEVSSDMQKLLDHLGELEREVVLLRTTSNMDYKDISELLGISSDNARQMYSRSLRTIRKLIEENPNFKEYNI